MKKSILYKNVHVINPTHDFDADVLIIDGIIDCISEMDSLNIEVDEIIDCTGKYLIPAGIDPHVHLSLPTPAGLSCDDFVMGSKAAIGGGTGALIDFVTPKRGESLIEATKNRLKESLNSEVPIKLHVGITWWDASLDLEIERLRKDFGIKSFKVYLAYLDSIGINFNELKEVMKTVKKHGGVLAIHAEEGVLIDRLRHDFIQSAKTSSQYHVLSRPHESEFRAVEKVLLMVESTKCPTYFVHISTAESVQMIREAKAKGLPVYAETCPQYLLLDDSVYKKAFNESAAYIISPPLRKKEDQEALWAALKDGTLDCVATDHCPFTMEQKRFGVDDFTKIPNGAGGIYHRMGLMYTYGVLKNRISLQEWIRVCSSNAADIFSFEGFGSIEEGLSTPLVLWNPNIKAIIDKVNSFSNADMNIYEGFEILGQASFLKT